MDLSCDRCDGYAECGEAVQDGRTSLELSDLTVEVPRHEALAWQFDTVHPCLDAAPSMVTAPSMLRAIAPGVSGFQGLTLFLGGMIAAAPRAAIASWHLRASKAGWLRHCSQNVGRVCLSAQPQIMAGSNQPYGDCRQSPIGQRIVSEPRCLSAALQAGQFRVLQA